ncbi:MAG: glycine zipper 2TM domain-containing protein [Pseudomonadota bacterium]
MLQLTHSNKAALNKAALNEAPLNEAPLNEAPLNLGSALRRCRRLAWLPVLVPALLVATPSYAGTSYERARVVDVQPLYKTVSYSVPVETCREEQVAYQTRPSRHRSATVPIVGAIIGGALGNAVGTNSSSQKVGAVVGAVLGGSVASDISRHHRQKHGHGYDEVRYRTEEVCSVSREVREEERPDGYRVSYVYGGETYTTRMHRDPGDSIRVRVRVSPAE